MALLALRPLALRFSRMKEVFLFLAAGLCVRSNRIPLYGQQFMMPHFSILLPVGLLLMGFCILLWSSLLRQRRQEIELRQSEARFHSFFENSPISLWEEDFSDVKAYIERLRKSGVQDFRRYFLNHSGEVTACAGMVKILDVNKATMKLYNIETKKDFFAGLNRVFGDEVHEAFIEELVAVASGKSTFEAEDFNRTVTGGAEGHILKMVRGAGT